MILTAYGEWYSEEAETLSKLSGDRHCVRCLCKIDDYDFCHSPRRNDGGVMFLCGPCATALNWKRSEIQESRQKWDQEKQIKMYIDGLLHRKVL